MTTIVSTGNPRDVQDVGFLPILGAVFSVVSTGLSYANAPKYVFERPTIPDKAPGTLGASLSESRSGIDGNAIAKGVVIGAGVLGIVLLLK